MAKHLKTARSQSLRAEDDLAVREVVENILNDVERRGDEAVHELSAKFDNYNPDSFLLTAEQIENALANVCLLYTSPSPRDRG